MENSIFELIINSGGLALALALLFYYSLKSFKNSSEERKAMKAELLQLQNDFHSFKNDMINKLVSLTCDTKISLDNLTDAIEKNFKCKS